jgi:acetoin utilization protein AcuC
LAHLALSVDGQRASYLALHDLAHEVASGKWVAVGGGGYSVVDVVPRAWTHLLSVVSGAPLSVETDTPASWRAEIRERLGVQAPHRMTDGRNPAYRDWAQGYDPDTWLDRAIQASREEAFPYNGLDPFG